MKLSADYNEFKESVHKLTVHDIGNVRINDDDGHVIYYFNIGSHNFSINMTRWPKQKLYYFSNEQNQKFDIIIRSKEHNHITSLIKRILEIEEIKLMQKVYDEFNETE